MKKYRTYTAKKYKLARKIIFYAVTAVLIFGITVLVGNHLKSELESAETGEPLELDTTAPVKEQDKDEDSKTVSHDEALGAVNAGNLDLSQINDTDEVNALLSKLSAEGHNAVSFNVTDATGNLTYASPAVEENSRLPASGELVSFEVLSAAARGARARSMRLSCVMTASESLTDELVVSELCELGFEEIVVLGFEEHTRLSNEQVKEIRSYVERLRRACDGNMVIGVSFMPQLYTAPQNAPYIEKLYDFCEFLAIDMRALSYDDAENTVKELQGSFTAYMLRPVLEGTVGNGEGSVESVLANAQIKARQYVTSPKNNDDTKE